MLKRKQILLNVWKHSIALLSSWCNTVFLIASGQLNVSIASYNDALQQSGLLGFTVIIYAKICQISHDPLMARRVLYIITVESSVITVMAQLVDGHGPH